MNNFKEFIFSIYSILFIVGLLLKYMFDQPWIDYILVLSLVVLLIDLGLAVINRNKDKGLQVWFSLGLVFLTFYISLTVLHWQVSPSLFGISFIFLSIYWGKVLPIKVNQYSKVIMSVFIFLIGLYLFWCS